MKNELADFVHLHLHTEYSLLDGACRIEEVVKLAHQYRMPALAITDHGNMFGVIEFYKKAGKAGLKPIIGMESYVAPGDRRDCKMTPGVSEASYHLTLLAENEEGYRNLMRLSSLAFTEGFYYKPRIDRELLRAHGQGLVALSGCLKGEIPQLLLRGELAQATKKATEYRDILGPRNFYLEIQDHHLPDEARVNPELVSLARELDIPLVATNDCHYLRKDMAKAHDVLLCIQTQSKLQDAQRLKFSSDEFHFRSPQEMAVLFEEIPEALTNTREIAERCALSLEVATGKARLPDFPLPEGYRSLNQYLEELARKGLAERYGHVSAEHEKRLAYELSIIERMGYAGYFLIVKDFIDFAREKGIPVGPGRGSAVGSLVCYALQITDVDPLKYGLLFERFLNPERVSMPDIDIDFSDKRRNEIIDHVINKYGKENVTQIITFGTLLSRAAIRDVGRVMGLSYSDVDRIAKLIPQGMSLAEAQQKVIELKELIEASPVNQELVTIAGQVEGLLRHAGTHAAGVVITPGHLTDFLPLYKGTNDEISTQYAMESLEDIGLLKMDFLGLRTLTVIQETERMVRQNGGDLDVQHVPLDDKRTFELLRRGDSVGVFQLESSGMRDLLRQYGPDAFSDLIALVSLFRPGPMRMIGEFVDRKHGRRKVEYLHPALESILKETYGIGVYQEQVMQMANALGGFSLGEADVIRRAMGKKKPEVMEEYREKFIKGAMKNKVREEIAQKVFQQMAEFAGYGFNKSHAAGYAILAYQTAYLKTHYPREFMAASLTSEMGDADRILILIGECREMGIALLPPDVNESILEFRVVPEGIRFGLGAVKNVGEGAIEELLRGRNKAGHFSTLPQVLSVVDPRTVNRKVLESLIKAGALDSLETYPGSPGQKRGMLLGLLEQVLQEGGAQRRRQLRNQVSLFDTASGFHPESLPSVEARELDPREVLSLEKEALGFYLSGHPLEGFREELSALGAVSTEALTKTRDEERVVVGGLVIGLKKHLDRKGKEMAFVLVEDFTGSVEVTLFSDLFEAHRQLLTKGTPIIVQGTVSTQEGKKPKILASDLAPLSTCREKFIESVHVVLSDGREWTDTALLSLKELFQNYPGRCEVYLRYGNGAVRREVRSNAIRVFPSRELMTKLRQVVGPENAYVRGAWKARTERRNALPRG